MNDFILIKQKNVELKSEEYINLPSKILPDERWSLRAYINGMLRKHVSIST